jgi:hypothetical protein
MALILDLLSEKTVDNRLMRQWKELTQIAESLSLREDEEDTII